MELLCLFWIILRCHEGELKQSIMELLLGNFATEHTQTLLFGLLPLKTSLLAGFDGVLQPAGFWSIKLVSNWFPM